MWSKSQKNKKVKKKMKRYKQNKRKVARKFTATALKTHPKNTQPTPMRGGYRI